MSAEELTRYFWEIRYSEMVDWLISEKRFNPRGARKCARNFIETMCFVAKETGEPQFKMPNSVTDDRVSSS